MGINENKTILGKIEQAIFCVILFVYGLNLFNRYFYISYAVIAICFAYIIIRHKIYASWQTLFTFGFLVIYWLLAYFINGETKTELLIECAAFYVFGAIAYMLAEDKHHDTFRLVLSGAIGFGVYGIISSFTAVLDSGRYMQDIWGGGRIAATQVAGWCMIFMAAVPWIIFKEKEIKLWNRTALYIAAALSVVSFFILSSRTGLIVSVVIALLVFYLAIKNKQSRIVIGLIGLFVIGLAAFAFDIGGIQTTFWNSNLILRMIQKQNTLGSAFDTGRTERWIYVISHFDEHMGGGYYYSKQLGGYIHNFSLDLYDECGIFALCAMTPFLIRLLVGLFKLQKRNIDIADRIGLIAWFAVIAILFMTEPVLYYGRTNLMAFFFFMAGIVEFSGALAYKEEHLSDAR